MWRARICHNHICWEGDYGAVAVHDGDEKITATNDLQWSGWNAFLQGCDTSASVDGTPLRFKDDFGGLLEINSQGGWQVVISRGGVVREWQHGVEAQILLHQK